MEYIDVVNDQDEVIGRANRQEIYEKQFTHRIVHVCVFNSQGEMALQRRSALCDYCPLYFATSAAGHVAAEETYLQAAKRELKEELGITDVPLELVGKEYYSENERGNMKFISVFRVVYDGDFIIDKNEVDSVKWYTLDQINKMQQANELFAPQLVYILNKFLY